MKLATMTKEGLRLECFHTGYMKTKTERSHVINNGLQQCFLEVTGPYFSYYYLLQFYRNCAKKKKKSCKSVLFVMSQRVTDITLSQLLALPFKTAVFLLLSKHMKCLTKHQF